MDDRGFFNLSGTFDLIKNLFPIVVTVALSCWGGIVSYIQRFRTSHFDFKWVDLALDLIVSSFAGLLTYLLCRHYNFGDAISAILIAISGHMGSKAISSFEKFRNKIFGQSD